VPQSYQPDDRVEIVSGPDAGRRAIVVDNFKGVYDDDLEDGALVRFEDGKPSNDPVPGQVGVEREFKAAELRRVLKA
jgi:hypothetical protein